jgi:hypothetical protein
MKYAGGRDKEDQNDKADGKDKEIDKKRKSKKDQKQPRGDWGNLLQRRVVHTLALAVVKANPMKMITMSTRII